MPSFSSAGRISYCAIIRSGAEWAVEQDLINPRK